RQLSGELRTFIGARHVGGFASRMTIAATGRAIIQLRTIGTVEGSMPNETGIARRDLLAAGTTFTAATMISGRAAQAQAAVTTFVLVHGSWHGGWCWRRVADRLERGGHKVYTPTLTGLGERVHLLTASVDLNTHITDVVNVIKFENLSNIVLVGHSYAGCVISGVAEQMLPAIASIVFVDAFLPQDGER